MPRRSVAIMDAKREALLKHLADGHTRRVAAHFAGIHENTVRDWETGDPEYRERLHEAELAGLGLAETSFLSGVRTDPKLALAYLERRDRQNWARQSESNTTVNVLNYVDRAGEAAERLTPERIIALVDAADRGEVK